MKQLNHPGLQPYNPISTDVHAANRQHIRILPVNGRQKPGHQPFTALRWLASCLVILLVVAGPGLATPLLTISGTGRAVLAQSVIASSTLPLTDGITSDVIWSDPAGDQETGAWPALEQVQAKAYVVMDRLTGKVWLSKAANTQNYPASTTKIMTALLALEANDLGRLVTVSANAVKLDWDASKAGFIAGEIVSMKDLLAGLMLPSGNDAAIAIAEALAGSQAKFARQMNSRARELGATKTNFVNPNGLHNTRHVTTALDLARIAAAAMRLPQFRELVNTPVYALSATNKHPLAGWQILINSNSRMLLADHSNYRSSLLREIQGIKTGTTTPAGNCLVTAAVTNDGVELICVLLGVSANDTQGNTSSYSRTLLEAAARKTAADPERVTLVTAGQPLTIPGSSLLLMPQASLTLTAAASQALDYTLAVPGLSVAEQPQEAPENGADASLGRPGSETLIQLVQDGTVLTTVPAVFATPTPIPTPTPSPIPTKPPKADPGTQVTTGNGQSGPGIDGVGKLPIIGSILTWFAARVWLVALIGGLLLLALIGLIIWRLIVRHNRGFYIRRR